MNTTPAALTRFFDEIDGTSLYGEEATYRCSKVPVQYALELPIPVLAKGSTVRYAFSTDLNDINFGIYIRNEQPPSSEQTELPQEDDSAEQELLATERVESNLEPITGSFMVVSAPCVVLLCWDNHYSWFKSKSLSYSVTVKPPSEAQTMASRKQRINIALDNVKVDRSSAQVRLEKVQQSKQDNCSKLALLEAEFKAVTAALVAAEKEEEYLKRRLEFRQQQDDGLKERLTKLERGNAGN